MKAISSDITMATGSHAGFDENFVRLVDAWQFMQFQKIYMDYSICS
ncbi:hypothetical protein [Piscirickettsia salmonis]|nr:hypothetical protein [Piscirickettsia salmonis]